MWVFATFLSFDDSKLNILGFWTDPIWICCFALWETKMGIFHVFFADWLQKELILEIVNIWWPYETFILIMQALPFLDTEKFPKVPLLQCQWRIPFTNLHECIVLPQPIFCLFTNTTLDVIDLSFKQDWHWQYATQMANLVSQLRQAIMLNMLMLSSS